MRMQQILYNMLHDLAGDKAIHNENNGSLGPNTLSEMAHIPVAISYK